MIILRQKNYSSITRTGFLGDISELSELADKKFPNQRSLVFEVIHRPNHPFIAAQIILGIEDQVYLEIEYSKNGTITKVGSGKIQGPGIKDEIINTLKEIEKEDPHLKGKASFLYSEINRYKV